MDLKKVFLNFFLQLILSLAGVLFLWFLLISIFTDTGILQPANAVEMQVSEWIAAIDASKEITTADIPVGTEYAFFKKDYSLVSTNMNTENLTYARNLALDNDKTQQNISTTVICKKIETVSQIVIIKYAIRARFRFPFLQKIFPNAELFLVILLLFFLLIDLFCLCVHHAHKLEKELFPMQEAARQIKEQNLDFDIPRTKIKEFNKVLDSLDALKSELKSSLLHKWELEQQQRQQMSALAHDIKTPLTILRGNAELLAESELKTDQQEYVTYILDNAVQIQRYVTQIIEISKQEALSYSSKEMCSLQKLLSHIEDNCKNMGKGKNLQFQFKKGEKLPAEIDTNEDGLKRVLWNILDNAVFYSPHNGTVTFSVSFESSKSGSHLLIFSISDEGVGFSEEALRYATTEFYRGDKSRTSKEHFGMGLAIANQIISQLGGELILKNNVPNGALVEIILYQT